MHFGYFFDVFRLFYQNLIENTSLLKKLFNNLI